MKKTAIAPSNIAFIKYWGKKNEKMRLPSHSNISMNLSNLLTTTTVEFSNSFNQDTIKINGVTDEKEAIKVKAHLDLIRKQAGISMSAKVVSQNNFPSSTGLSSSASGFAALTVASCAAAGLSLTEKELSILARIGSGSACRSIPDGFVEWMAGEDSQTSYGVSLYPPDYWNMIDVVAVASRQKKSIPTTEGHMRASSSPFYQTRLDKIEGKLALCKKFLAEKDFLSFGELIEREALEMHAVMITSDPPLLYWLPATILIMKEVQRWRREEGLACYFTINTGQDLHIICQEKDEEAVIKKLSEIPEVQKIIPNRPSKGTRLTDSHLF